MPLHSLHNESARLRRLMANPARRIQFTSHALQAMKDDQLIAADVLHVLTRGSVTWTETKKDLLWHVEASDLEGRSIRAVIATNEVALAIKIVTVMVL